MKGNSRSLLVQVPEWEKTGNALSTPAQEDFIMAARFLNPSTMWEGKRDIYQKAAVIGTAFAKGA